MDQTNIKLLDAAFGKPAYARANVRIYQGDCLSLLRELRAPIFDLTVTSPPYNIGKEYETVRDVTDYVGWVSEWIGEVHRTTVHDGAFWLNLGYLKMPGRAKALPIPYLLWDKVPFFMIQEVVWNYGAGVAAKNSFSPRNEKFIWYVKDEKDYHFDLDAVRDPDVKYPNQKKNGKLKCNPLGKNPSDVWQIAKVTSGANRSSVERTPHPAQFPVALVERVIKASSQEGDLILDPFLGSGSTAEVAIRLGRSVVGIELRQDYISVAAERLDRAFNELSDIDRQISLFA